LRRAQPIIDEPHFNPPFTQGAIHEQTGRSGGSRRIYARRPAQAETVNCTAITTLPYNITTQGEYCLAGKEKRSQKEKRIQDRIAFRGKPNPTRNTRPWAHFDSFWRQSWPW
jgi:hypothetical protein